MRRLTGEELGKIRDILLGRFDLISINTFSTQRLNIPYYNHVSPIAGPQDGFFQYVDYLNRNWKHYKLIDAYLAEFPDDPDMLRFAAEFQMLPAIEVNDAPIQGISALEALVNAGPFLDIEILLTEISRLERTVCRIEIKRRDGNSTWGTGFLVGSDLLLSNYHVFEKFINDPGEIESVNCLFDYKVLPDGGSIERVYEGKLVKLAPDPIKHYSEVGSLDRTGSDDLNANWEADKLDYVLIKLEREVGNEAIGQKTRGWISFPPSHPLLSRGTHGFIIQHPDRSTKKIVFGFEKIMGTDNQGLRVRYNINTMRGSSGSPVFNHKFQLIALHNAGDPNYAPQYNQGIPIKLIQEDLQNNGFELT